MLLAALVLPDARPNIEMMGFRMVESQDQHRSLELQAKKAQLWRKISRTALHDLEAKIWGQDGEVYVVTGALGVMDSKTQDFRIEEDAEITTPDGYVFKSRDVTYLEKEQSITGEEDVTLGTAKGVRMPSPLTLKGRGLHINLREGLYTVEKSVRTEQKTSDNKNMVIDAGRLDLYPRQDRALFIGGVRVRSPTYVLKGDLLQVSFKPSEGPESRLKQPQKLSLQARDQLLPRKVEANMSGTIFKAKGLDVFLDANGEMSRSEAIGSAEAVTEDGIHIEAERLVSTLEEGVQKMRMYGNVTIQTPDRQASCEEAVYIPSTGNFVLERLATIHDEDQNISGERIQFSTKNRILKVEKASGQIQRDSIKN